MNKTRFVLTSALVLLGFGLMAPECDCDKDQSGSEPQNVLPSGAEPQGAGALPHVR